jgi:quercetin dioxygenase-like cupin family protein
VGFHRLDFDAMPWTPGTHPLERKKVALANGAALIEFAPGFVDPQLCKRGHVIYVLRGCLGLELGAETQIVFPGNCCILDSGTPHRAFTHGEVPVALFIVSADLPLTRQSV